MPRYVLFIDDYRGAFVASDESFQAISLEEIGLNGLDLLRFSYDVVELATVVKPHFLKWLFKNCDLSKLIYLDPDILVLNALDQVFEKLNNCNVILTPHLDADFPDDGYQPDIMVILACGLYNLGFVGCRNSAEGMRFLDWWEQEIRRRCTRDGSTAHFVDQKVVDVAPLLFEGVYLERGPGYNVAYWNIHSRTISFANGEWFSNNQPLYFFHFSAFNPENAEVLSRNCTRPLIAKNRPLLGLLREYRDRLLENDYLATNRLSYGHSRFVNGEEILYATRKYFRMSERLQREEPMPFRSARMIRRNRITVFQYHHPAIFRIARKIWALILRVVPSSIRREQYP
ncbi:MAG: hypothetical protein ACJ8LL_05070 [Candidatus Udaeobacter sp.]